MTNLATKLFDRGYKRILFVLLVGLLGSGLAYVFLQARARQPVGSWEQQPQPPVPLTQFVKDVDTPSAEGEVYATAADGTLYALACSAGGCAWDQRDVLPSPDQDLYDWCPEISDEADESIRIPAAPGRVVDSHATRYCGVDYWVDSRFVLLDDGSVWEWGWTSAGIAGFYAKLIRGLLMAGCGVGGLILGVVVIVVARHRLAHEATASKPEE